MSRPSHLTADCDNCCGLCCVAPNFERSETFAYTKPAGEICHNLTEANRCAIHDGLAGEGFSGCVAYECYGAGQKVTQELYPGRSWRADTAAAEEIFTVYFAVKALHELMVYLTEAGAMCKDENLTARFDKQVAHYETLTSAGPEILSSLDTKAEEQAVKALIAEIR